MELKIILLFYETSLHLAAINGHSDVVSLLIQHQNVDINASTIFN